MKKEELVFLNQIQNTLELISTKGEDTLLMADCLRALKHFIQQQKETQLTQEKKETKEE